VIALFLLPVLVAAPEFIHGGAWALVAGVGALAIVARLRRV